jgi:hypothetical protein
MSKRLNNVAAHTDGEAITAGDFTLMVDGIEMMCYCYYYFYFCFCYSIGGIPKDVKDAKAVYKHFDKVFFFFLFVDLICLFCLVSFFPSFVPSFLPSFVLAMFILSSSVMIAEMRVYYKRG